jgi:hypothetical protein
MQQPRQLVLASPCNLLNGHNCADRDFEMKHPPHSAVVSCRADEFARRVGACGDVLFVVRGWQYAPLRAHPAR